MWRARHRESCCRAATPMSHAGDLDRAARRPVEAAQQIQQRRLARARRPHQRQEIARRQSSGSTPCSTSMRSPPRVNDLCTSGRRPVTRRRRQVRSARRLRRPPLLLRAVLERGRRRDDDPLAGREPGQAPPGGRRRRRPSSRRAARPRRGTTNTYDWPFSATIAAFGTSSVGGARGPSRRVRLAQERHLDAHVGQDPRVELSRSAMRDQRPSPSGGPPRARRDDVRRDSASRGTR